MISLGFVGTVVRAIMGMTKQNITRPATMNPRETWALQDCVDVGLYF